MSRYLVKLVRDRVAARISVNPKLSFDPIATEDVELELRRKLGEEVTEYLVDPSLDELAGIIEVVHALAQHSHLTHLNHVIDLAERKREARGGFDLAVGMYVE